MKYEKPNVALVASAVEAVKGSANKVNDEIDGSQLPTAAAAYESDE